MYKSICCQLFVGIICIAGASVTLLPRISDHRLSHHLVDRPSILCVPCTIDLSTRPALPAAQPRIAQHRMPAHDEESVWDHAHRCTQESGQLSAHFGVYRHMHTAQPDSGIGVVVYVAHQSDYQAGDYSFRIEITQQAPDCSVCMYDSAGTLLVGPVPMRHREQGNDYKRPFLPWQAHMTYHYSLVVDRTDTAAPHLLLIQHTKEFLDAYVPAAPIVKTIIDRYARHERLQQRPGAYLEMPHHMFCLPIPYSHPAYEVLADGPVWVACAAKQGLFDVLPS